MSTMKSEWVAKAPSIDVLVKLILAAVGGGLIGAFLTLHLIQGGISPSISYLAAEIQQQQPQYDNDFQAVASPISHVEAAQGPIAELQFGQELAEGAIAKPPCAEAEGPTAGKLQSQEAQRPKLCSRDTPQGTESLPPGIVVIETDLYPRRLWGKPEEVHAEGGHEDLKDPPKYLLAITVGIGQKASVNEAVKKFPKEWQILLFHYDGNVTAWDEFEWSQSAIHVSVRKQTKWWYAKRFLHPDVVAPYDYIFIWDEDLDLRHFNASRYIELCKKYGLELSQPGQESPRYWEITRRRADVEVHKELGDGTMCSEHKPPCGGFVEVMAPVFSRKAWRCIWHIIQNDLVHGWGLDVAWHRCVESERMGIVDEQWMIHMGIPTLRNEGVSGGKQPWEEVNERCIYEFGVYEKRWNDAYAKQAELGAAKGN